MKRIKAKFMISVLMVGVLSSGTMIAKADSNRGTVGGYSVAGETYISTSNYSAYCRTVSSSHDVSTEVDAGYGYYDPRTGAEYIINGWNAGKYGCEVYFNLPSGNYVPSYACAWHLAAYGGDEWTGGSSEDF